MITITITHLIIYLIGFILSMAIIAISDRTFYKNTDRVGLGHSLLFSFLSYILVIILLIFMFFRTNFWKKLDNLWKWGKYE